MKLSVIQDIGALHPLFTTWWQARKVAAIPLQLLPALGLLATDDTGPLAAVWVYMERSISLGALTWFVTRPELPGRKAAKALHHLVEFASQEAQRQGITVLVANSDGKALSRFLENRGFRLAGTGITQQFKLI